MDIPIRPAVEEELLIIDTTIAVWMSNPNLNEIQLECRQQYNNIGVVVANTNEEMKDFTGYCMPGCVKSEYVCPYGCAAGVFYMNSNNPVFVGASISWPRILSHETGHWLGFCTNQGIDRYHENPYIWGPDGVVDKTNKKLFTNE